MKFTELYEKYDDCLNIHILIKIDGQSISYPLEECTLDVSRDYKANIVSLRYSFKLESDFKIALGKVIIGSIIDVIIDYKTGSSLAFKGYIHAREATQTISDYQLEIVAQDVTGLMMSHQRLKVSYNESDQKVIELICKDTLYQPFITDTKIISKEADLSYIVHRQESDYEILKKTCEQKDFLFYVRGGLLIIEEGNSTLSPTLDYDSNFALEEIQVYEDAAFLCGEIVVVGCDDQQVMISHSLNFDLKVINCKEATFKPILNTWHNVIIQDEEKLKVVAKRKSNHKYRQVKHIVFQTLYVPELVCGRKITFTALTWIQGEYILSALHFVYNQEQIQCECYAELLK